MTVLDKAYALLRRPRPQDAPEVAPEPTAPLRTLWRLTLCSRCKRVLWSRAARPSMATPRSCPSDGSHSIS